VAHSERSGGKRFDRDYGVTTHAILFLSDLDPHEAGEAKAHATHYEAVPVADFRKLLEHVPADVVSRSTFVDVGAGMGRALLLASESPFVQVIGVEVSGGLYEVTRDNLARANRAKRRCNDLRVVRADARIWNYPPGDLVVFLFNPFDGYALAPTIESILGRRRPGATWLIYHTPIERAIIDADPRFEIVAQEECGVVYKALGVT
jgi:SAM-dependent methyltransferase